MVIWNRIFTILEKQDQILKEMASNSLRGGKKLQPMSSASIASPASQRQIDEMLLMQKEKEKGGTALMQRMNSTLNIVQETMLKLQELITNNHTELKADISRLDNRMEIIQTSIQMNEQRITIVEKKTEQNERKIEAVDLKLKDLNKEFENSLIHLETERSLYTLRFQNIVEANEENLGEVMTTIVAGILQISREEAMSDIDEMYRIQTNYVKKHQLPREVHLRFTRKSVRDRVYAASRDGKLTYKGRELNILKQIPRRVRELRKDYKPLALILNKKDIPFRWLIPEGMMINLEGRREKIDTPERAREILEQLSGLVEELESGERSESSKEEDFETERGKEDKRVRKKDREVGREREKEEGTKTRSQRAAAACK